MKKSGIKDKIFTLIYNKLDFITFTKLWSLYQENAADNKRTYHQAYVTSKCKSKKKYFIVRMTWPTMGAGAVIRNFILIASWAEKNGWIPILDWEYEETFNKGKLGVDNFQDVFFENPISLKSIVENNYCIVGTINKVDVYDGSNDFIQKNMESCYCKPTEEYFDIYYKTFQMYLNKYFPLNSKMVDECRNQYKEIFNNPKNVLAIMIREEFSAKGKKVYKDTGYEKVLERHPSSISVDEAIKLVYEKMNEWNYTHIFVTSIMQETIEIFKKEFGEKVFFVKRERFTWDRAREVADKKEEYSKNEKEIFPKDKGMRQNITYLKEIFIASQCGYLIGCPSTGVTLALSINGGKYLNKYIAEDYSSITKKVG